MAREIIRVCNGAEREILAPHVEKLHEAKRVLQNAALAFEQRMATEGLIFDSDTYTWARDVPDSEPPAEG
jgi:hypothetical protein